MKINWSYFEWNTSSSEDTFLFAYRDMSYTQYVKAMLSHGQKEVRFEAKKFKKISSNNLRRRARRWCVRMGFI